MPKAVRAASKLPEDPVKRREIVGGLLDFAKWLHPAYPWVDEYHVPIAEMYERDLDHLLSHRGSRGGKEFQRITKIEIPRESLKTTLGVISNGLWLNTIWPDLALVFGSRREDLSKKSLGVIKRIIEGSGRYKDRFGERKPTAATHDMRLAWAADGIITNDRIDMSTKERCLEVVGVKSLDPGVHYDGGLWDDAHGDDTPKEIDATKDAMRNFVPILHPWGVMPVTMTVWDYDDVPEWMDTEWKDVMAETMRMVACNIDDNGWPTEVLMPKLYTFDQLCRKRKMMGSYKFGCQYGMVRTSSAMRRFAPSYYREERRDRRDFPFVALTWDPRYDREDRKADRSAEGRKLSGDGIVVGGTDRFGAYHQFDCLFGRFEEDEVLDRVFEKVRLWKPDVLGIERNAVEYFLRKGITKRMDKLDLTRGDKRPRLEPLMHARDSKVERIRWMVDPYKAGEMTFSPDMESAAEWKKQLFDFRGNVDDVQDLLDAAAYQFTLTKDRAIGSRSAVDSGKSVLRQWYEDALAGKLGRKEAGKSWTSV